MSPEQIAARIVDAWVAVERPDIAVQLLYNHELAELKDSITAAIRGERDANAAFVVTACNNHDALVAALMKAQIYLKHCTPAWRDGADKHANDIRALLAALKARAAGGGMG